MLEKNLPESVKLLALGDAAWTLEFGETIDPLLHGKVLGLGAALEKARISQKPVFSSITDVVPTFRSLTVHYNPLLCDGCQLGEALVELAQSAGSASAEGRAWQIPVCFDEEFALDLQDLVESKNLSQESVIQMLCAATFQVYMIGFMPGFPYMGGLPKALEMPRLSSPRKSLPARSLAIAGAMCAVYPWESPGGWRLLGRTPIPMFNAADTKSPALLASGDAVRWQAIDRQTYDEMEAAFASGQLTRQDLLISRQDLLSRQGEAS